VIYNDSSQDQAWCSRTCPFEGIRGCSPPYDKIRGWSFLMLSSELFTLGFEASSRTKYCLLGKLSSEVGWNHYETIKELENKRKERAQLAYERKKQLNKLRVKAEKVAEEKLGPQLEIIAPIKY
ncbi:Ribosomal protein L13 family protein, partial [Prunus dulcis]